MTLDDPASSGLARLLSIVILVMIVISVVALVCESAFVRAPAGRGCEICGDAAKQEECRDGGDDTLATCLATCGACEPEALPIFAVLEFIFIPLFTLEYLLQVSDGGRIRPPSLPRTNASTLEERARDGMRGDGEHAFISRSHAFASLPHLPASRCLVSGGRRDKACVAVVARGGGKLLTR